MNQFNLIGSVLPNTNKIISESDADWSGIREGVWVKFVSDNVIYQGIKTEPLFYIEDFTVIDEKTLKVNKNTSIFLHRGDDLTISYKEQEISTVFQVINGGRGYKTGDDLFLDGGIPSQDVGDGTLHRAIFRVLEILPGGIITKISVESKGRYIEIPGTNIKTTGGNGTGCELNVGYKPLDARACIERNIENIQTGNETIITLNYNLSKGIKEGKLSVKKNALVLSSNYLGPAQLSKQFSIAQDFTINYKWPLLIQNSFSINSVFNRVIAAQDQIIKDLEKRIEQLESKLS